MSSIRERLGLNDVEQKNQTFSIRERLGITQESLEEEKNNQEIQQRIKEENSIVQSRKKTGLKWIDKNLKNIDAKTYENAQNLSDYQNDNSAIKLGSTVGDLAVNVGKGFVGGVENVVDLGRYGVAGIADLLGAKNYANDVRERAKQNTTDILFSPIENTFDKNSLLKKNGLIENVAQGVGQIGAIVGGGGLLPKAVSTVNVGKFAMPTTSILTGAGSAMTEAYNNGATNGQALASGIGGGLVEGFSESLFGGLGSTFSKKFGGGALDDVIVKRLTDKISNKTLQTLAQSGLKATGEGFEEVVSGIGNAITKKLTYMNNEDIRKLINDEDLLNSFVVGTLTSAVAQTPSTINSIKTGKSYINLDENSKVDNNKINNQNNISNDSLQQSTNNTDIFSKQVDEVLNGNFPQKDMLIVSQNTPKILQDIGLNDLPITLTQRHLKTIMNASGEYKGANYHNLGVDLVKQLPQAIANPLNVLKSNTDSNSIVVITELADKQDRPVIASIKIDGRGQINNIEIDTNVLTSAYGKDNYDSFMKKNIANGNMLYDIDEGVTKKSGGKLQLRPTTSTLETISRLQLPNNSSKLSENNISQSNENVKSDTLPKYSMQNNENNTQEHLEKNYKATGTRTNMKSLELPTVNKETKVTNKADTLPTYSDVNNITKQNLPTIKELNAIKYENNKNAIGRLEQEKNKTIRNINSKIKSKITEYNSKQNKNTIVANKLNQQIAVLNNQKQNIEAEYNKKINNLKLKNEKMTTVEFKTKEQKMSKKQEYDQLALSSIENMKTWKDKDKGIKYKTNTMDRNFYDIIPNKNEAKRIVDTYISPITENNAKREKFITKYNKRIEALNLNEKESIAVQMLGEAKYIEAINDKAMFASEIIQTADEYIEKNKLSKDKIQNAVNEFRKVYDELYTEVNMVLKEQGFKEIEYRKNYFPHFEETTPTSKIGKLVEKLGWKFSNNEIPTSIAGITDTFRPNRIWTSFTQKRYGNHTSYNALKGFDNYIRGASDLIFHTEDIQKLRSLENMIRYQYSEKSIQEEYDNITNMDLDNDSKSTLIDDLFEKVDNPLGNLVTELRSYTDDLANKKSELDRRMEHSIGRQYYNTAKNIQNRLSANMVGLNISSALTNFIPITQAWGQVSTKNLIRGMKQSISNGLREDGLVDNSVFLTNRTKQADRLYKTNLEKISNKVNIVFDTVDSFTANTIVRAKYLDNLEKGMNHTQAMENADKFAKSIMAGRDKGSLPTIFNSKNPIIKLFTSFQLEVANQYNYMLKDIPMDLKKEGLLKLTSAFLKMFLGAWIYNKVSESITGRKSAFSPIDIISETVDELKKDTSTYNKLSSTTTNLVSELPFVGGILGGGRLPISSALPNLGTTIESFTKLGDDNKRQSAIKNLKKELSKPLFYIVMPFGGGQMKKTIEGLSMYDKNLPTAGSYTNSGNLRFTADESIGGKIKSALFGQYSSKEAQDYIDSGYKSISKNKIQEMKDLNMTSSEYRNYQKGLSNSGKKNENKLEYINGLDVSNEQKNIMANNVVESDKYTIDMSKYNDYDSYEEMKYANENSQKYNTITSFDIKYNDYKKYKENIDNIKEQYSGTSNAKLRKEKVAQYIESLPYSKNQKMMLYKTLGNYSIKNYKKEMYEYIEGLKISKEEKETIWNQLYGGE